nr:PI-actitoxin-Afv2b-like [Drosophila takahashii]
MGFKLITIILVLVAFCTITRAYDKGKCDARPSVEGPCLAASVTRWTFKDKKCQPFEFTGCGHTANFFRDKVFCERACQS